MEKILRLLKVDRGVLVWAVNRRGGARAGDPAGTRRDDGYGIVRIDGETFLRHRVLWACHTSEDPGARQVDHRNVTPGDDWVDNLRAAENHENLCNRGRNSNNTSGFKGVSWDRRRGKFRASIVRQGRQTFLGYFDAAADAHAAYSAAAATIHGEFARS